MKAILLLLWSAVMLVAGAYATYRFDIFAATDYEACAATAARQAPSDARLALLLDDCASEFPGRRAVGGGYSFVDPRTGMLFDVLGPKLTTAEVSWVEAEYSAFLGRQAEARSNALVEQERDAQQRAAQLEEAARKRESEKEAVEEAARALAVRTQRAAGRIQVTTSIECKLQTTCSVYRLIIAIDNQSKETINKIALGWIFVSDNVQSCPNKLSPRLWRPVVLKPGDTTVLNADELDGPSNFDFRYCITVDSVEIQP